MSVWIWRHQSWIRCVARVRSWVAGVWIRNWRVWIGRCRARIRRWIAWWIWRLGWIAVGAWQICVWICSRNGIPWVTWFCVDQWILCRQVDTTRFRHRGKVIRIGIENRISVIGRNFARIFWIFWILRIFRTWIDWRFKIGRCIVVVVVVLRPWFDWLARDRRVRINRVKRKLTAGWNHGRNLSRGYRIGIHRRIDWIWILRQFVERAFLLKWILWSNVLASFDFFERIRWNLALPFTKNICLGILVEYFLQTPRSPFCYSRLVGKECS